MDTQTSFYDNPHDHDCTCPNCGYVHHSPYDQTYTRVVIACGMIPPRVEDPTVSFRVVFESERYENERRSRALGRAPDAPQRCPRLTPRRYVSARMVHAQRCPARRPRRSLRERIRLAW